jgi:hypothetical protein
MTRAAPYDDLLALLLGFEVVNEAEESLAMVVVIATARNGRSDVNWNQQTG